MAPKNCRAALQILIALSVIIFVYSSFNLLPRFSARTVKVCDAHVRLLSMAIESFHLDTGRYPTNDEWLDALVNKPEAMTPEEWKGPYLRKQPFKDPWGNPYQYVFPSRHGQKFDIYSLGQDGRSFSGGDDLDDINNWATDRPWQAVYESFWDDFSIISVGILLLILAGVLVLLNKAARCVLDLLDARRRRKTE